MADGHSQVWQWLKVTATYRKLMNTQSGKVLDIVDMREDDGAPAQIWDDVDGAGQQWKLVESSTASAEEEAPQEEAPKEEPPKEEAPKEEAPKKRPSRKAKAAAETPAPAEEASKEEAPAPKKRAGRAAKAAPAEEKPAPKRRGRKSKEQA